MRLKIKIAFLTLTIVLLLSESCSTGKNYKLLSFFFDGVPVSDSSAALIDTVSLTTGNDALNDLQNISGSGQEIIKIITIHYPYEEKECNSCHVENSPGEMVLQEPELCYICHDDFSLSFASVHGPVAAGFCTECHSAHKSENSYLLLRTGQNLCISCHDLSQSPNNDMHSDIGDTECTLCHNPHGGEDKYLIR